MIHFPTPVVLGMGVMAGAVFMILSTPIPKPKEECTTYQVSREIVTSFALKPPPAEPIECPKVEEKKCAEPVKEEASAPVESEEQPKKKRHYRHRRYRRYW